MRLGSLRTTACLAGCFTLAALAFAAPSGAAGKKAIWGPITLDPGQANCPGPLDCSAFPIYNQLGVDTFQATVVWSRVALTRPLDPRNPNDLAYRWPAELSFAVSEASRYGIQLAFRVQQTPGWANGGRSSNWAPNRSADYADFLIAASRRYPSVRMWMIWGEPSRKANFRPSGRKAPRRYARLLRSAYHGLKSVRPSNIVIGGMTLNGGFPRPPAWLRRMRLKGGKPPPMDWYGHNPFDRRRPRLRDKPRANFRGLNDIDTLRRDLRKLYKGRRRTPKLWLSEWTVQTDHSSAVFRHHVSRKKQAKRIRAAYRMVRRLRYVKGLGWFALLDYPPGPQNPTWGLMTHAGIRKPGFYAYAAAR